MIVILVIVPSGYPVGAHLEVHFPFSTRDLWFFRMMFACRKSLFNMKILYSKNTNGNFFCLILSCSNNDLGLNTFIFLLSIYYHLCNNLYPKVIVVISFNNKMQCAMQQLFGWDIDNRILYHYRTLHGPIKTQKHFFSNRPMRCRIEFYNA